MGRSNTRWFIILLALLLLLSACSRNSGHLDFDDPANLVTDKFVIWWNNGIGNELMPVKKALESRFERTTFEIKPYYLAGPHLLTMIIDVPRLMEMMKEEPAPDLIVFDTRVFSLLLETGYLDPIPNMYALEMDEEILTQFRSYASDLDLYALPFGSIAEGLFYNKTIFDEMQVPYPEDGMTWEEIIQLSQSFVNGSYYPLEIWPLELLASQYSFRLYDPETGLVDFYSGEWEPLTQMILNLNRLTSKNMISTFSNGKTAMFIGQWPFISYYEANLRFNEVDWDIASYPLRDDGGRIQPASQMFAIGVPASSKNKGDAYRVMRYLLSRDMQLESVRRGLVSYRADAGEYIDEFGQSSVLNGKNVSALFSDAPEGKLAPIFEFESHMSWELRAIGRADEHEKDTIVDTVQRRLRQHIPILIGDRQQFIEEMRSRF